MEYPETIRIFAVDKIPRVSCHILCGLDPVPHFGCLSGSFPKIKHLLQRIIREYLSHLADLIVILLRDGAAYVILVLMTWEGKITVDQFV